MMGSRGNQILREPGTAARTNEIHGWYKGIVEDVRDLTGHGRIRVRAYAVHGDYKNVATKDLPWAEGMFPNRGGQQSPEVFDRVWVSFEGGNPERPIWNGYWVASPDGSGKLPFNRKKGLETAPEAWSAQADHYPTSASIFRTGEGDQMWVEDHPYTDDHMVSAMNIADAGNKYLRISSVNKGTDYRPKGEKIDDDWGETTTYRQKANGAASSVNRQGEMRLEAGSFRMHNSCSGANSPSFRMESNGTQYDSSVSIENGLWVTQTAGKGNEVTSTVVNRTSIMLQAKGRVALQGKHQPLPGRW